MEIKKMDTGSQKHFLVIIVMAGVGLILAMLGELLTHLMMANDPMFKRYYWLNMIFIVANVVILFSAIIIATSERTKGFLPTINTLIVVGMALCAAFLLSELLKANLFYNFYLPRLMLNACLILNVAIGLKTVVYVVRE